MITSIPIAKTAGMEHVVRFSVHLRRARHDTFMIIKTTLGSNSTKVKSSIMCPHVPSSVSHNVSSPTAISLYIFILSIQIKWQINKQFIFKFLVVSSIIYEKRGLLVSVFDNYEWLFTAHIHKRTYEILISYWSRLAAESMDGCVPMHSMLLQHKRIVGPVWSIFCCFVDWPRRLALEC